MPPVLVGGRSDRAVERAAQFGDAWLPMWVSPETLAQRGERLAELAARHGRPTPGLSLLMLAHVDADLDVSRAAADAHLRGQYGLGLDRVERWTALGEADRVAEVLGRYIAAGVSEILLLPLGARPLEQIERLAAVVASLRSLTDAA